MPSEDIFLSIAAVILFMAALGVGYYVLMEVVGVVGELTRSRRERRAQPSDHALRGPDDTIPLPIITSHQEQKPTKHLLKPGSDDQQRD